MTQSETWIQPKKSYLQTRLDRKTILAKTIFKNSTSPSICHCRWKRMDDIKVMFGFTHIRAHEIWRILLQVSGFIDMVNKTSPDLVLCYLVKISRCTRSWKSGFFRLIFRSTQKSQNHKNKATFILKVFWVGIMDVV